MNGPEAHRRRRHYIDAVLQGRLLRQLILGELLLFALALFGVWWGMREAVEAGLYRVHHPPAALPVLVTQLLWFVPLIVLVNLLAVGWSERRWRRKVAAIVDQLDPLLERIRRGDLRPVPLLDTVRHPVLDAACHWRDAERERFAEIARIIESLPDTLPPDPAASQTALAALRASLMVSTKPT